MKYKKRFLLIILIIILILTTTGCLRFNGSVNNIVTKYTSYDIDYENSIQLEKIKNIEIGGNVNQINFNISENNEIKVHLYGSIKSNYEPELVIDKQPNYVEIRTEKKNIKNMKVKDNKLVLDVFVPENYYGDIKANCISGDIIIGNYNLDEIEISLISGNIEVNDIKSNEIKLETISGNIHGKNLIANNLIECESISGEVHIEEISAKSIECDTTSSNIKLNSINTEIINISTISGNSELLGDIGAVDIETTSGDIYMEMMKLKGDVGISTVSGDLVLDFPEDASFEFELETISGKIDTTNFDVSNIIIKDNEISGKKGTGQYHVELQTVSGNVNLK